AEPEQVIQTSVPWHLAGSLLGLDLGLSQTLLRRLSSDPLPVPPRLLAADREVFTRTVSLLTPNELADRDVETIAGAISAGRRGASGLPLQGIPDAWPVDCNGGPIAGRTDIGPGCRSQSAGSAGPQGSEPAGGDCPGRPRGRDTGLHRQRDAALSRRLAHAGALGAGGLRRSHRGLCRRADWRRHPFSCCPVAASAMTKTSIRAALVLPAS